LKKEVFKEIKMKGIKYTDEIRQDRDLGYPIRVRYLERLTPELETTLERMEDFYKFGQFLHSRESPEEALKIIQKYIDVYSCGGGEGLMKALGVKAQEFQKEQSQLFKGEDTDAFFNEVTDGRYPSLFTLNHSGSAEPQSEINGGVYVCTFKNLFWDGQSKLYVFGSENGRFKDYLRKVRAAAEEIEEPGFFKGLPLEATKEQIKQYIQSNPDAMITGGEHKNPEEGMKKYGTNFVISPSSPVALTRLNGRVKKQDLGELIMSCFMGGIQKSEEEKKNGKSGNVFKGTYTGRDNIEAVTVFYSGLPYNGLGDWGGRIEVSPNEIAPEVYRDFKDTRYRFGDLAELMIDLRGRKVVFFDEK